MLRFKKKNDVFEPTSFVQNIEPFGWIVSIPENVVNQLSLKPDDRLIWLQYERGIIKLKLRRAKT